MQDKYLMDSHKLHWHLDRVRDWLRGKKIAPIHIDVGLSKGCNIRCEYCFGVLQGNFYRKGSEIYFPQKPLFRYIKDLSYCKVKSIGFIGEGEPLLNPYVYEAILLARKHNLDVSLGTNGILFDTSKTGIEALRNLSWIRFNISAGSEEGYRRTHRSNEFNTVIKKIEFCTYIKKKHKLAVTIGLQMVLTPNNIVELIPLAKLGKKLAVDYLVVKQCSDTIDSKLGVFHKFDQYENFFEILKEAEKESTKTYKVIVKWKKITNKGIRTYRQCLGAPFLLYSSGDGKLYPCGMFFNYKSEEYCMGDLVKQSFKEIIRSKRYWNIIEKVKNINVSKCYSNCRTHSINEFLWEITHPPKHINFI